MPLHIPPLIQKDRLFYKNLFPYLELDRRCWPRVEFTDAFKAYAANELAFCHTLCYKEDNFAKVLDLFKKCTECDIYETIVDIDTNRETHRHFIKYAAKNNIPFSWPKNDIVILFSLAQATDVIMRF